MDIEYNYYIKYKLFSETEYEEFKFEGKYSDLKDAVFQLGKGIVGFNGKIIKGFSTLEDIQISEQNYDFKSDGKHYELCEIDEETREQMGADYHEIPACLEDEMNMSAHQRDITNQLFRECNVSINSLGREKGIRLEEDTIYVSGTSFEISTSTKLYELLDIILRLKYFHNNKEITYEMIKAYYMENIFEELKVSDIKQENIRNILKTKMEIIRDSLGLSELPISAQKSGIVFRI